jgi:hypothetical protein
VLERPGYQFREELPAGEDPLACGRERRQRAVLDQLYAAQNAIGYLSYLRFSIRIPAAANAAFYRLTGLLTT